MTNKTENKNLTFGCDPEVFACTNTSVISPALLEIFDGLEPQRPDIKHPVYKFYDGYSWMADGAAFELTTEEIFKDPRRMYQIMVESLQALNEDIISKHTWKGENLTLVQKPTVKIDPNIYLQYLNTNEKIFQGFIFGCDQDWDAILPDYICETLNVREHLFRYGGGHFHIGSENSEDVSNMQEFIHPFIQLLAITVGNICISRSEFIEEDKQRVFHYGKPGRFRPQKWGVEYRTPSNAWMQNLGTIELMMEGAKKAFYYLNTPKEGKDVIKNYLKLTIDAITTADQNLSSQIISSLGGL